MWVIAELVVVSQDCAQLFFLFPRAVTVVKQGEEN